MPSDYNDNDKQDLTPAQRQVKSFSTQMALAMELPFVLVASVAIGGGVGYLLDRYLHTQPWLMLILGGFGFYAGVREILRRLPSGNDGNAGK